MEALISLAVKAKFVENLDLSVSLEMCTFIAVSKKLSTYIVLGMSVMLVQYITIQANHRTLTCSFKHGELECTGVSEVDLPSMG